MKLLIADDMEGVSGVVDWKHVDSKHPEYNRFRRILTAEVNAAAHGAFDAQIDEVVVSDGHGSGKNVLIEELDQRLKLNSGNEAPFAMMQGIDNNVDAVAMIGYHARYGTLNGVLAHTWSGSVRGLWLNDVLVGEIGLNAYLAGYYGAPVIMITSDQAGCNEAEALIPGIETVVTKIGSSNYSAECLSPEVTQPMICEAVEKAVKNFKAGKGPKPLKMEGPITAKLQFDWPIRADQAALGVGVKRIDGTTVSMEVENVVEAYHAFRQMVGMASVQ